MVKTIDSYSETNKDNSTAIHSAVNTKAGQAFQAPMSGSLYQAKFYLLRVGSPTGNATASLFACTGTPGTTGKGTGAALATSTAIDVTTISNLGFNLVTFTFSAPYYSIVSGTNYVIVVEYSGGNSSNYLDVGIDQVGETHPGNFTVYDPTVWDYWAGTDGCFYVIGYTWGHKFMGIANASISKINGIAIASISKVNGVA